MLDRELSSGERWKINLAELSEVEEFVNLVKKGKKRKALDLYEKMGSDKRRVIQESYRLYLDSARFFGI